MHAWTSETSRGSTNACKATCCAIERRSVRLCFSRGVAGNVAPNLCLAWPHVTETPPGCNTSSRRFNQNTRRKQENTSIADPTNRGISEQVRPRGTEEQAAPKTKGEEARARAFRGKAAMRAVGHRLPTYSKRRVMLVSQKRAQVARLSCARVFFTTLQRICDIVSLNASTETPLSP